MKLTNRLNLPQAIVNAIERDPYDKGDADFSCTGLIRPPYMARLERDYHDEIEEDVIDRIWALRGQVMHSVLERGADENQIAEVRLFAGFKHKEREWRLSGQADVYLPDIGLLQDFKDSSVWSVRDGVKPEWEAQLNILAELVRRNGGEVHDLQLVVFFRDWSAAQAKRGNDYPQDKVQIVPVTLWRSEDVVNFITRRLLLHQYALDIEKLNMVTPCNDEEVWAKPTQYAVMKKGRKSAVKLHDDQVAADKHAGDLGKNHWVEKRPGRRPRCEDYCRVSQWCPAFEEWKKNADDAQDAQPSAKS